MLSHRNLVSNARSAAKLLPESLARGDEPVLSVLPFAHIYEARNDSDLHDGARRRASRDDAGLLGPKICSAVRPRVMNLVPRIFERILAGIVGRARAEGGVKAMLVPWALEGRARLCCGDLARHRRGRRRTARTEGLGGARPAVHRRAQARALEDQAADRARPARVFHERQCAASPRYHAGRSRGWK